MTIIIHVIIALLSLGAAGAAFVTNRTALLRASYALTAMTLASGVYLVIIDNTAMLHTCITGLVYLVSILVVQVFVRRRIVASHTAAPISNDAS